MKKLITILLVIAFVLSTPVFAPVTWAAESTAALGNDHVIDKVGDWFATRGKTEKEKQAILAERKAARVAKRAEKKAAQAKKKADQEIKKAQKGVKKGFGRK